MANECRTGANLNGLQRTLSKADTLSAIRVPSRGRLALLPSGLKIPPYTSK